jgi:hypothetical protein
VLVLLRQVRAGLDQLQECGVTTADLHPSNMLLRVGKGGVMQTREFERLMQKRLDAWPPFLVKLRAHTTMRSLYEPLTVEGGDGDSAGYMSRAFLALAIYLLTGERRSGGVPSFGETVSESLAAYLRECAVASRRPGLVASPGDFLENFEKHMSGTDSAGRGFAAIMGADRIAIEDMESVGTVSDFDDGDSDDGPNYLTSGAGRSEVGTSIRDRKEQQKPVAGMLILGLGFAALVALVSWFLFGGQSNKPGPPTNGTESVLVTATPTPQEALAKEDRSGARIMLPETGHPIQTTQTQASPAKRQPPVEIKKAILPTAEETAKIKNPTASGVLK